MFVYDKTFVFSTACAQCLRMRARRQLGKQGRQEASLFDKVVVKIFDNMITCSTTYSTIYLYIYIYVIYIYDVYLKCILMYIIFDSICIYNNTNILIDIYI